MLNVVLVIHLFIALALVGVILLQRSEGGALGIGGGGVMTGRAAGNLLTRTTAILAAGFFATSLGLALIANARSQPSSIMDTAPVSAPAAPAIPAPPPAPAAPLSR
jgi:preprotein translocase subunit SecG